MSRAIPDISPDFSKAGIPFNMKENFRLCLSKIKESDKAEVVVKIKNQMPGQL